MSKRAIPLQASVVFCITALASTRIHAAEPQAGQGASSDAPTHAQTTSNKQSATTLEVRLALSESAAALLTNRVKELLAIELDNDGYIAANAYGPLGDNVAYVWIDVPEARKVVIQTRVGRGPIASRSYSLRQGLRPDVAARIVAIATADMIQSQAKPQPPSKPKVTKQPTPEQIEAATRDNPAMLLSGKAEAAWIPSFGAVLAGPSIELAFRFNKVRPYMAGSWLIGSSTVGTARWTSLTLGADRTFWCTPSLRFDLGLNARAAVVSLDDAVFSGGGGGDSWTAIAALRLRSEHAVNRSTWIGLSVEPGLLLRRAPFESGNVGHSVSGFYMGAAIAVQFERRTETVITTPIPGY